MDDYYDDAVDFIIDYVKSIDNIEIWRDVVGYEGLYQVSNQGNVKSLDRYVKDINGITCFKKGKIKNMTISKTGYYVVYLYKDNKLKTCKVHRLVAYAFLEKPKGKEYVDHINTNRLDNRADNLRWVTHKENCNNPLSIMNYKESAVNRSNVNKIVCLNTGEIFNTLRDAANKYNIKDLKHISNCCKHKPKSKTSGIHPETNERLVWLYYDEYIRLSDKEINQLILDAKPKITYKKVRCVTTGMEFESCKKAAEYYKIKDFRYITKVCNGFSKSTTNGLNPEQRLIWEYIDE